MRHPLLRGRRFSLKTQSGPWLGCASGFILGLLSLASQPLTSRPAPLHELQSLKTQIVLQTPLNVALQWRRHSAEKRLSFAWPTHSERITLSFNSERPPTEKPQLGNSCRGSGRLLGRLYGPFEITSLEVEADEQPLAPEFWWLCGADFYVASRLREGEILVHYQAQEQAQLRFPLLLTGTPFKLRAQSLGRDGSIKSIAAHWRQGTLELAAEDYRSGSQVQIFYDDAVLPEADLYLPHKIDDSSLSIQSFDSRCTLTDFLVENRHINAECPGKGPFEARYTTTLSSSLMTFDRKLPPPLRAQLTIDGEPSQRFFLNDHAMLLIDLAPSAQTAQLQLQFKL